MPAEQMRVLLGWSSLMEIGRKLPRAVPQLPTSGLSGECWRPELGGLHPGSKPSSELCRGACGHLTPWFAPGSGTCCSTS